MKQTRRYKVYLTVACGLGVLLALVLTACQRQPAVWQDAESTGEVDVGEISQGIFDGAESNGGEGSEVESVPETESYLIEDVTTEEAEIHLKTPAFSAEGGVYDSPLAVTMTCSEDYTIRYTTDGSVPTSSSRIYQKAITVLSNTVKSSCLRAACFDDNEQIVGDVTSHTYVYKEGKSALYVVSITMEKDDLDYLCDHYAESYERPAHVEVVTPNGDTVVSQDAGVRIFGGSSRSLPQKSFKIIARKNGYFDEGVPYKGGGSFKAPLFPDRTVKAGRDAGEILSKYDSFILRNGGNDSLHHRSVNPDDATLLRDGLANRWAFEVAPHVDSSLSQFAEVYVNGKYYGLLDMRENLNEDYVKRVYGVADEDVVVVKSELDTNRRCEEHENGGMCRYCNAWFYYETDDNAMAQQELADWLVLCRMAADAIGADDATYAQTYGEIADRLDLESFKEYMALGMYVCNTDWPHNNVKLWRYTGAEQEGVAITDGKWRFMTRDMDMAFARYSSPHVTSELDNRADVDTFYWVLGQYLDGYRDLYSYEGEERLYPDSLGLQGLLAFCLRNDEFRNAFADYCRLLSSNESRTHLMALYEEGYDAVFDGIQDHVIRWFRDMAIAKMWRSGCEGIKTFIRQRSSQFESYLDVMLGMYP